MAFPPENPEKFQCQASTRSAVAYDGNNMRVLIIRSAVDDTNGPFSTPISRHWRRSNRVSRRTETRRGSPMRPRMVAEKWQNLMVADGRTSLPIVGRGMNKARCKRGCSRDYCDIAPPGRVEFSERQKWKRCSRWNRTSFNDHQLAERGNEFHDCGYKKQKLVEMMEIWM
ncbi:hypothetical protein KM043_014138 [Ampulex compressa]|nr:hypothetical protein KM043_014138 [Ampulex compressa]